MCFLLTALVAFSDATHDTVISSGLVPQLVVLCRSKSEVGRGRRWKNAAEHSWGVLPWSLGTCGMLTNSWF
jgi:hypothetical protein